MTIDIKVLRASALKHLENGRYEDSRQIFEQIIGIGTISTQMLSEIGYVYWLLGRVPEAEQHFLNALEIDPCHENSLINITEMHLRAGRMVEADDYLDRLLLHYSDHATSHIANARKQFVAGDKASALSIITNVVEKWVSDISIQLAAAKLLFQYQCYYDAVSLSERIIGRRHHGMLSTKLHCIWSIAVCRCTMMAINDVIGTGYAIFYCDYPIYCCHAFAGRKNL